VVFCAAAILSILHWPALLLLLQLLLPLLLLLLPNCHMQPRHTSNKPQLGACVGLSLHLLTQTADGAAHGH